MKKLILTTLFLLVQLPAVATPFPQQDAKALKYLRAMQELSISLLETCSYSDLFVPQKRIKIEIKCESMQRQAPAYFDLMEKSTNKEEFDKYAIRLTDIFNDVVNAINN